MSVLWATPDSAVVRRAKEALGALKPPVFLLFNGLHKLAQWANNGAQDPWGFNNQSRADNWIEQPLAERLTHERFWDAATRAGRRS